LLTLLCVGCDGPVPSEGTSEPAAAVAPPPIVTPPPRTPVDVEGTIGLATPWDLSQAGAASSVRLGLEVAEPASTWEPAALRAAFDAVTPALTECHRVARTSTPALNGRFWVRVPVATDGTFAVALSRPPTDRAPRASWSASGTMGMAEPAARALEGCTLTTLHALELPAPATAATLTFLVDYEIAGSSPDVPLELLPPHDPSAASATTPTGHVGS
jgi:hypothetical protein